MSTKQVIIDGYLKLGIQKGFDNVSLNDIANYAQIKKATIFSHFRDSEDLKTQAINYSLEILNSKNFEINPKANNAEELFLDLLNSFIDVFANYPVNELLCLIEQKHAFNEDINQLSERIDLMIQSRFQVAFDFCVQRSWTDTSNPDILALLFANYLRKLISCKNISDDTLSDFVDMILESL